ETKISQLAVAYLAKAQRHDATGEAFTAIQEYFRNISADIRKLERARLAAEPSHLDALAAFAEHAWRRPLSSTERDDLLAFYRTVREQEGMDHEEGVRDTIVSVLMSPRFCYRLDLGGSTFGSFHSRAPLELPSGAQEFAHSSKSQVTNHKSQIAEPLSDYALA